MLTQHQQNNINPNSNNNQTNNNNLSFATVEISDALVKIALYTQKLVAFQQASQQSQNYQAIQIKCRKILRLAYQSFLKYGDNQQFAKGSFEIVKSSILNKKSYYSLYLLDLMLKNSKHVIKLAKKQVESMMKLIWQKTWTQFQNQQKIQNLKIMIKCWGYIYSEKMQQNIRKWLDNKYSIKRIQLKEQNQKAIKHLYSQKNISENNKSVGSKEKDNKISEALLNSLVNDNDQDDQFQFFSNNQYSKTNSAREEYSQKTSKFNSSTFNNSSNGNPIYSNKIHNNGHQNFSNEPQNIQMKKTGSSSSLGMNASESNQVQRNPIQKPPTSSNNQVTPTKKLNLQGVNKSLLQALDLD